jgi:hypothetical protein
MDKTQAFQILQQIKRPLIFNLNSYGHGIKDSMKRNKKQRGVSDAS